MLAGVAAPADGEGNVAVDLKITNGRVAALAPAGSELEGIDVDGGQVWPGLVDAHVHLDKTQIWPRAANLDGTPAGARIATAADRTNWTEDDIRARGSCSRRANVAHRAWALFFLFEKSPTAKLCLRFKSMAA
jgi:cytosine deaminase